jgi:hypothetical protein
MWIWETLQDFLTALLGLLTVCAIGAVLGSFGFQLHHALHYVKIRSLKRARWRLAYGVLGTTTCAGLIIYSHAPWQAWLMVGLCEVSGFFGYFMVPEGFGE